MTEITLGVACGTPLAPFEGVTFHCRFCRQDFSWERASYALIWSRILVHLGQCAPASWLSRDERSAEARRVAEALVGERPRVRAAKAGAPTAKSKHSRH